MSTWSSFPKEKQYTDKWREFLEEANPPKGYKKTAAYCDAEDEEYETSGNLEDFDVETCGHPPKEAMSTQDIETYKHMVRGKTVDFEGPGTAPAPAAAPTPEPDPARAMPREDRVRETINALVREMEAGRTSAVRSHIDSLSDDPELQTAIVKGLAERGYNLSAAPESEPPTGAPEPTSVPEPFGAEYDNFDLEDHRWLIKNIRSKDDRTVIRDPTWAPREPLEIMRADQGLAFTDKKTGDLISLDVEALEIYDRDGNQLAQSEYLPGGAVPQDDPNCDEEEVCTPDETSAQPAEEEAKQKILNMFEFEKATLDNVDLLLTAGSIIPFGWGCMVGAVNSVFNFSRGEWLWGAFDAVFAMPPICGVTAVGETASVGKGIFKVLRKVAAKLGAKSPKALAKAAKTLGKAEKAALKNFDQAVKVTEKGMAKVIGKEAAEKYSKKYVGKLLGAIKGKKTKEQVSAVLALLPDSFFENMDEVLNKPVKDIWGAEIVAKMDKLLESVGVDLVGEKYEELLNGAQVDMVLFLANKSGALSDDAYPEMTKTIAEIRKSANADKSLSAEERIEKFIGDVAPAEPSPAEEEAEEVGSELYGGFPSESKAPMRPLIKEAQLKRWQQLSGIKPRVL